MQLLQLWSQSFQEPIIPVPLQQAIAALSVPCSMDTSSMEAAVDQPSDVESQAAAIHHLSLQQRIVIARLVTCIQAVRSSSSEAASFDKVLLRWLTLLLTSNSPIGSPPLDTNKEQSGIQLLLQACMRSPSVAQLLLPGYMMAGQQSDAFGKLSTEPIPEIAVQADSIASQHTVQAKLQGKGQQDSPALNSDKLIPAHSPDTAAKSTEELHSQHPQIVDAGCLRFSSQLANRIFTKPI